MVVVHEIAYHICDISCQWTVHLYAESAYSLLLSPKMSACYVFTCLLLTLSLFLTCVKVSCSKIIPSTKCNDGISRFMITWARPLQQDFINCSIWQKLSEIEVFVKW